MKRRSALKNIGMAFGYTVAAPTLLSLLESCKDIPAGEEWAPAFLDKEQGHVLAQTVDVILPKTDTPSATEVNVHRFIDAYLNEVMPLEQREFVMMKMNTFNDKILADSGKGSLLEIEGSDIEPALQRFLKHKTKGEMQADSEAISKSMQNINAGSEMKLDEDIACSSYARELRDLALWAYKNSEFVGEEVLAYLPVPGEYISCGDVNTLTGGKAWSL